GDAPALALGGAAPDAVVDAVAEGVLQALGLHRALSADASGGLHAEAVAREEGRRGPVTAQPLRHPFLAHEPSLYGAVPVRKLNGPAVVAVPSSLRRPERPRLMRSLD